MSRIEKKHPTEAQKRLLMRLSGELEGGARDAFQVFLMQLEDKLATQKLKQSYKTSESVTQLVDYERSFEGRDGELRLTYHNPYVTDANFKPLNLPELFEAVVVQHEFRVYRPNRRISSEKIVTLMKNDGYRPATALELLEYYAVQLLQGVIVCGFILVSLGTVWDNSVVCMYLNTTIRNLSLGTFDDDWDDRCEFLAVHEPTIGKSA